MPTDSGDSSRILPGAPCPAVPDPAAATPRSRGAHVAAPLAAIRFDRDALSRADEAPGGEDVRYVVTAGASVSVSEGPDGMNLALETEDPRTEASHPLVHLGRWGGLRIVAAEVPEPSAELDDPGRDLRELRRVATQLTPEQAGLALTAVGMGSWHRTHRHCPQCGGLFETRSAGWVLRCRDDGSLHFPRTDPAVIMAVRDDRDRLLLARNASFRARFHSVLAGFVEPGETLEAAVAREVLEEVGVTVCDVEYAGSQPWPFPRSLMLGFTAQAPAGAEPVADGTEILSVRWFEREELAAMAREGEITLPGAVSIARALIEDWYGGTLPDAQTLIT